MTFAAAAVGRRRRAEPRGDDAQRVLQRDFERRIGEAGEFARDLFERPIADDVVDADAQCVPVAESPERAQHRRVVGTRRNLGLELVREFGGRWIAPRGVPYRFEELGISHERVGEELRRGKEKKRRFESAIARFQKQR